MKSFKCKHVPTQYSRIFLPSSNLGNDAREYQAMMQPKLCAKSVLRNIEIF